jgi:hypothetical protein
VRVRRHQKQQAKLWVFDLTAPDDQFIADEKLMESLRNRSPPPTLCSHIPDLNLLTAVGGIRPLRTDNLLKNFRGQFRPESIVHCVRGPVHSDSRQLNARNGDLGPAPLQANLLVELFPKRSNNLDNF